MPTSSTRRRQSSPPPDTHGLKLGTRIAHLVAKAMTEHLHDSAHYRVQIGAGAANEFFGGINDELRQHLSPLWQAHHDELDDGDPLKAWLRFLIAQPGEGSAIGALLSASQAVSIGIGAGLADLLAPVNQRIMQQSPNLPLGAQQAAAIAATGFQTYEWAATEASRNGINADRFALMFETAKTYLSGAQAQDALNRGLIAKPDFLTLMQRNGLDAQSAFFALELARQELAPTDAALAVLRGNIPAAEGQAIAARNGVIASDFNILVENTGEPPGLMQLLEAFRRGFIDQPRLVRGVKQSRVRDEWIDVVEKLRYSPPDTSDAIRGVVQGHLALADAERIANENGLEPGQLGWMIETAGNPPGVQQMLELLNRGEISEATAEQAIRESRYKNKYIGDLVKLRRRLPPQRTVVSLVTHGAISEARGIELLLMDGYEQDIAVAMVHAGARVATHRIHTLATSEITAALIDHLISEADATTALEAIGWNAHDAAFIIAVALAQRERQRLTQAMNAIRSRYVAHKITRDAAVQDLRTINANETDVQAVLGLWDVERSANVRTLTEAQIVKAGKDGIFTPEQVVARLEQLGYTTADAEILVVL